MNFRKQRPDETFENWKKYVVASLRSKYKKGLLNQEEIEACEAKGITFIGQKDWKENFAFELEYLKANGDWNKKSKWLWKQKRLHARKELTDDYIEQLESKGFDLTIEKRYSFKDRCDQLQEFIEKYNKYPNAKIPGERELAKWREGKEKNRLKQMGFYDKLG